MLHHATWKSHIRIIHMLIIFFRYISYFAIRRKLPNSNYYRISPNINDRPIVFFLILTERSWRSSINTRVSSSSRSMKNARRIALRARARWRKRGCFRLTQFPPRRFGPRSLKYEHTFGFSLLLLLLEREREKTRKRQETPDVDAWTAVDTLIYLSSQPLSETMIRYLVPPCASFSKTFFQKDDLYSPIFEWPVLSWPPPGERMGDGGTRNPIEFRNDGEYSACVVFHQGLWCRSKCHPAC